MPEGAGDYGDRDRRCAVQFENTSAFIDRGAGGHHIVDQQHALASEVAPTFKSAAHICPALLERQVGLSRRGSGADDMVEVDGYLERLAKCPGDLGRLVEPALDHSLWVEGEGNNPVKIFFYDALGQQLAEPGRHRQLVAILQSVNDPVKRKVVMEQCNGSFEIGRVFQASPAAFAVRGLVSAEWAKIGWQSGKVCTAFRAEQLIPAVCPAQQATARQQGFSQFSGKVLDSLGVG